MPIRLTAKNSVMDPCENFVGQVVRFQGDGLITRTCFVAECTHKPRQSRDELSTVEIKGIVVPNDFNSDLILSIPERRSIFVPSELKGLGIYTGYQINRLPDVEKGPPEISYALQFKNHPTDTTSQDSDWSVSHFENEPHNDNDNSSQESKRKHVGISNLHNFFCYGIAILQMLFHLPGVEEIILKNENSDVVLRDYEKKFVEATKNLMAELKAGKKPVDPKKFLAAFRTILKKKSADQNNKQNFINNTQEDSGEFFVYMLDFLNNKALYKMMQIGLDITKKSDCGQCTGTNPADEYILYMEVGTQSDTLFTSLKKKFEEENLDDNNKFRCRDTSHKKKGNGTHKISIRSWPTVLTICLKRFDNNLKKKRTRVTFPKKFSFADFKKEIPSSKESFDGTYHVHSIVFHKGTFKNGHYTLWTKPQNTGVEDDQWYFFNDEKTAGPTQFDQLPFSSLFSRTKRGTKKDQFYGDVYMINYVKVPASEERYVSLAMKNQKCRRCKNKIYK